MEPVLELSAYDHVVVLTGAGVSVASGLPTYRGEGGLWTQSGASALATKEALEEDPEAVWRFFARMYEDVQKADVNEAHRTLARWENERGAGQTLTLLTQNVDGLHEKAGSREVYALHGSLGRVRCVSCEWEGVTHEVGSEYVPCPVCGAPIRFDIVLFGEYLSAQMERCVKAALRRCDLFIAVGTSGTVWPASNYARSADFEGARTMFVNLEDMGVRNPYFHEVHLGRAEEVLPRLTGEVGHV